MENKVRQKCLECGQSFVFPYVVDYCPECYGLLGDPEKVMRVDLADGCAWVSLQPALQTIDNTSI